MQQQVESTTVVSAFPTPTPTPADPSIIRRGVLAVRDYARLSVRGGMLHIEWGTPPDSQYLNISQVDGLRRLVIPVVGHGSLSYAALRWLNGAGVEAIFLDRRGDVLLSTVPAHVDLPTLRRRQAIAGTAVQGLSIAQELIQRQVVARAALLRQLARGHPLIARSKRDGPSLAAAMQDTGTILETGSRGLKQCESIVDVMSNEAIMAAAFWACIAPLSLRFTRRDSVAPHLLVIGDRHSALTNSPQRQSSLAMSTLNYLLGVTRGELRFAVIGAGLDEGLAFLHADRDGVGKSLLDDLIEPLRPTVEGWWLNWLGRRVFGVQDFTILPNGELRLSVALRTELGQTAAVWRGEALELCDWLAAELGSRRSAGRGQHGQGWQPRPGLRGSYTRARARGRLSLTSETSSSLDTSESRPLAGAEALPQLCAHCERQLAPAGEVWCSRECGDDAAVLARLSVELRPRTAWTPQAWELLRSHLQRVPPARLMAAVGCSPAAVSMWKSGRKRARGYVWAALAGCGGQADALPG